MLLIDTLSVVALVVDLVDLTGTLKVLISALQAILMVMLMVLLFSERGVVRIFIGALCGASAAAAVDRFTSGSALNSSATHLDMSQLGQRVDLAALVVLIVALVVMVFTVYRGLSRRWREEVGRTRRVTASIEEKMEGRESKMSSDHEEIIARLDRLIRDIEEE